MDPAALTGGKTMVFDKLGNHYRVVLLLLATCFVSHSLASAQNDDYRVPGQNPKYCDCKDVSREDTTRYDNELFLDQHSRKLSIALHNPWGPPRNPTSSTNEKLLVQEHYVINHDADLRVPTWVAYRLTEQDLAPSIGRRGCFRRDIRLSRNEGAVCGDYDEPAGVEPRYDRGHLVPSGDMVRSEAAMVNTYMFSNVAPQHDAFNQGGGIWRHLEDRARDWAKRKGTIYIIAGSIFDRDGDGLRDDDSEASMLQTDTAARVAIPTHFFKIVIHARQNQIIDCLAFIFEHVNERVKSGRRDEQLKGNLRSIDEIEKVTGITFLPDFTRERPDQAANLKSGVASSLWPVD